MLLLERLNLPTSCCVYGVVSVAIVILHHIAWWHILLVHSGSPLELDCMLVFAVFSAFVYVLAKH